MKDSSADGSGQIPGVTMSAKPNESGARKLVTGGQSDRRLIGASSAERGELSEKELSPRSARMPAEQWNYSSSIKIFYTRDVEPAPLTATGFIPMPTDKPLPGFLCQAARGLINVTQAWLWQNARVSRKTINDFENGYASPKIALNLRIRRALEAAGAQFVYGQDLVGVVVYSSRSKT